MNIFGIISMILTVCLTVFSVVFFFRESKIEPNQFTPQQDDAENLQCRLQVSEHDKYLVHRYIENKNTESTARGARDDKTTAFRRGTYGR